MVVGQAGWLDRLKQHFPEAVDLPLDRSRFEYPLTVRASTVARILLTYWMLGMIPVIAIVILILCYKVLT